VRDKGGTNDLREPGIASSEETLDPDDRGATRAVSHQIVDDAVDYLSMVRELPVWRDMPAEFGLFLQTRHRANRRPSRTSIARFPHM
jgi:hypothetical protein